ncbi:MAG: YncE family protein [Chitinophagaceae bacterium]|nr:YncE family protein [Oligoflexus sp.]
MKLFLASLAFLGAASAFSAEASYKLSHRIPLTGAESWDYLSIEPQSHRLFVTRGNHVDVIDLQTDAVIGKITKGVDGAHGIAFISKMNKAYLTSGNRAKVLIFNLTTLEVQGEIATGEKPDAVIYDDNSGKLFVFNGISKSITVIDPATDTVIKTIVLDGRPEFAVALGDGIFFNNENTNSVGMIETKTFTLKKVWTLPGCEEPTGLSANAEEGRLFSVCKNGVMVVSDSEAGKVVTNIPIGNGADASVFDDGYVFSSNGVSGNLNVIKAKDANTFEIAQTLTTQVGARTMMVDPTDHKIYTISGQFVQVDPATPKVKPAIIPGSVEILVFDK